MFQDYYTQMQFANNINADYFKTLTNFMTNNNYIIHSSKKEDVYPADLFLCHCEKNFTITTNNHLYKYIDNIIIFSANHIKCLFPVKYPSYFNLSKNILTNNCINFLDLKIVLNNQQLCIDMYDKRKVFHFKVNALTNFNSCMYLSVYRNNLLNHMLRIKNLCSTKFKTRNIKKLIYDALIHEYLKRFIYSIIFH